MIITKKHLSRRTFLGATVALPLLDAMIPALSAAPTSPFRFGAVYFPCGVWPATWHPEKEGSDFEFKPVMQPLEQFRDQLVTVSKMKAPWGSSVHLGASSAFLNGIGPANSRSDGKSDAFGKIESKKTIDQHIADKVAGDTPCTWRSIEVGTEDIGHRRRRPRRFPPARSSTPCRGATIPTRWPVGINPRITFERMLGETDSKERRFARLKEKQSLLDSVTEETSKLKRSPRRARAAPYSTKYLGNIRDVEKQRLRTHGKPSLEPSPKQSRSATVGLPDAFDDHMTITYNLMHLAYQGGIRHVFTFHDRS